jgi:hypothetical protein
MPVDEDTEGFDTRDPRRRRCLSAVDLALSVGRPLARVSRRRKASLIYRRLRRTWTRQEPDVSLVKIAIFVLRTVCIGP